MFIKKVPITTPKDIDRRIVSLETDIANVHSELNELNRKYNNLEAATSQNISSIDDDIRHLAEDIEEIDTAMAIVTKDASATQARLSNVDKTISAIQSKQSSLDSDILALKRNFASYDIALNDLKNKIASFENAYKSKLTLMSAEITNIRQDISTLRAKVDNHDLFIANTRTDMQKIRDSISAIKEFLSKLSLEVPSSPYVIRQYGHSRNRGRYRAIRRVFRHYYGTTRDPQRGEIPYLRRYGIITEAKIMEAI